MDHGVGPGQVSRLPPDLEEVMAGILNGVHDRSREDPVHSPQSDDGRNTLADDLQKMSEESTTSTGCVT